MAKFKDITIIVIFGLMYVILFMLFMPHTLSLENPTWWYEVLGKNVFTILLWSQLTHGLGMLFAAIPIAVALVWLYPKHTYLIAFMVATVLFAYMGFDQARGAYLFGVPDSLAVQLSHIADLLKPFIIMFLSVFVFRLAMHTNKLKSENASKTDMNAA